MGKTDAHEEAEGTLVPGPSTPGDGTVVEEADGMGPSHEVGGDEEPGAEQ